VTQLHEAAVVVCKNGDVLLRQCGDGERWAGLWDFPRFAMDTKGPLLAREEIVAKVRQQIGISCRLGILLRTIRHGVTRYRITLDCYRADYSAGRVKTANGTAAHWVDRSQLADYPLSTTGRKIAGLLSNCASADR
jgi:A/G-specific adenine glycosylase